MADKGVGGVGVGVDNDVTGVTDVTDETGVLPGAAAVGGDVAGAAAAAPAPGLVKETTQLAQAALRAMNEGPNLDAGAEDLAAKKANDIKVLEEEIAALKLDTTTDPAVLAKKITELEQLKTSHGGRRRSKRRHPKKGSRKSKKSSARKSKKGGRSRKNGSKHRKHSRAHKKH